MLEHLIDHARKNIWCSPEQDYQAIIKLALISHKIGVFNQHVVLWEAVRLPTQGERYHVFQIGRVDPKLLGMLDLENTWITLESLVNDSVLMCEVYTNDGRLLPRMDCYLRWTKEDNLIIAIKDRETVSFDVTGDVYVRFYTNAFYSSARSDYQTEYTKIKGKHILLESDISSMQSEYRALLEQDGNVIAFHNGYWVDDFIPTRIAIGDVIEYVYDRSFKCEVEFKLNDAHVFDSRLDGRRKFLLHPPKESDQTINFEDDVDIYIRGPENTNGRFRGVHYHRNKADSIRMLTHNDYSIPVDYVNGYLAMHQEDLISLEDITIRMYVRSSGYKRPLVLEANRIFELYRLDDTQIVNAMIGIDSTITEWKAEILEDSAYPKVMRSLHSLDPIEVQEAYGYNGFAKVIGDTPQSIDVDSVLGEYPKVTLKPGHWLNVTIYEYDRDGKLLGWFYHPQGQIALLKHMETKNVEVIVGKGTTDLDVVFGELSVPVSGMYNYRAYLCSLYGEEPYFDWVDVTDDQNIVTRNDVGLEFNVNSVSEYPCVMCDSSFIADDYFLAPKNGVLKLSISVNETHFGVTERRIQMIPPRAIDLWLNGRGLIENIDYYVSWPEVVIVNKEYLLEDAEDDIQQITVRATGFCNTDLTLDKPRDYGFVTHGYLSADRQYDVRDDKVFSLVVGGYMRSRDQVDFAEDSSGIIATRVANGTPYMVREIVVPLRGDTYLDTYGLRKISGDLDYRIGNYLSVNYPEPVIDSIIPIEDKYVVYSPFLSRIIDDFQNNILDLDINATHYSNKNILDWLNHYEYLLKFDPAKVGVDTRFVQIHPHRYNHETKLSIYQYNFLVRANELYFGDLIDLSQFIEIEIN